MYSFINNPKLAIESCHREPSEAISVFMIRFAMKPTGSRNDFKLIDLSKIGDSKKHWKQLI